METYLFIALAFIYLLTAFILSKQVQKRIWTVAYILAFAITCVAIFFIKSYAGETLMRVGELNWYYILYVFGSISIILGVINLWMYKRGIIACLRKTATMKRRTTRQKKAANKTR